MARKKTLEKKHAIRLVRGSVKIDGVLHTPSGKDQDPQFIMVDDSVLKSLQGSPVVSFTVRGEENAKKSSVEVDDLPFEDADDDAVEAVSPGKIG